jgi:hypothetical protein
MIMPGFHDLRIRRGKVNLTELDKQVIVRSQDLQDTSSFIRYDP